MGLRDRIRKMAENKPDHYPSPSYGPQASFGTTDSQGRPVVNFTTEDWALIRGLDGVARPPSSLYETQHAVRICVDFLARNIAQLNLKTYRRESPTDRPEVPDHELARLIQRPNPRSTRFMLIRDTVADMALYDNAYWWKVRRGGRRMLFRVPPAYIYPYGGNILTGPEVYRLNIAANGEPRDLEPSEVVHFRGYNPVDPRTGASTLSALRTILREELEASRQRARFFEKNMRVGGFIKRPPQTPWTEAALGRFREGLRRFSRGGDHEEEWAVLEDGMEPVPQGVSPKDAEFIAGREWALEMVATAYHIPLALLSRTEHATFASLKEFHKVLYVDTLGPINSEIEGAIALDLVPEFGDEDIYVEFNIEEKLQGDWESQLENLRAAVQVPFMAPNTAAAKLGLPLTNDPRYDVPARPQNYLYGDEAPERPDLQVVPNDQAAALPEPTVEAELAALLEDR